MCTDIWISEGHCVVIEEESAGLCTGSLAVCP